MSNFHSERLNVSLFQLNNAKDKAKCDRCPQVLTYCGGTTTLRKHLTQIHKVKDANAAGDTPEPDDPASSDPVQPPTSSQVPINVALARYGYPSYNLLRL